MSVISSTSSLADKAAQFHPGRRVYIGIGCKFMAFAAIAFALSALSGAPFTAPTENISHALGVCYIVPFAIAIGGYAAIQLVAHIRQSDLMPLQERFRNIMADLYFLLLFVLVIYLHFHIKMWMPLINPVLYDDAYFAVDNHFRWLLDIMKGWREALAGKIPSVNALYQAGFVAMFAISLWAHAMGNRRWHFHNMYALLLMEMTGALAYLFAPAVGPFMFESGTNEMATKAQQGMLGAFRHVQEEGIAWLAVNGGNYFTGPPAAMPSLHIAGAFIIAWYMVKARSVLAPFMVLMTLWIGLESVVTRWHYLIDLPPGLMLAMAAIFITDRVCRPEEPEKSPSVTQTTLPALD